jgi:hypothetical protein
MRPVAIGRRNWIDPCRQSTGRAEDCGDPVVESCRSLKLPVRDYLAARFLPDSLIARSSASQASLPVHGPPSTHNRIVGVNAVLRQPKSCSRVRRVEVQRIKAAELHPTAFPN